MISREAARIILVEDNPGDVQLVERTLRNRNIPYKITHYEDGEQAMTAMMEWPRLRPSLILLDLNLPRCEGFDVLSRARQQPALVGVPIGILTSSEAPKDRHRVALIGAERYIHKPAFLTQFIQQVGDAIEELLAGQEAP